MREGKMICSFGFRLVYTNDELVVKNVNETNYSLQYS